MMHTAPARLRMPCLKCAASAVPCIDGFYNQRSVLQVDQQDPCPDQQRGEDHHDPDGDETGRPDDAPVDVDLVPDEEVGAEPDEGEPEE